MRPRFLLAGLITALLLNTSPAHAQAEQVSSSVRTELEKVRQDVWVAWFNNDQKEAHGTSLRTERVKILTWNVDDKHVIDVMRMLKQTENGPFLIHCQHGADRTGLMSAMYRILEQGWTVDDALTELTAGGYGYHSIWTNILRYVRSADVDRLRAAIGASPAPSNGSTSTVTVN